MSNKSKKKEKQAKAGKELEKRVEEEQRKLEQLRKRKAEGEKWQKPGVKKQKKGKDREISDKINVKMGDRDSIQKNIDYHRFLEGQQRKLDYAAMFSYLGGNVRKPKYEYAGASDIVEIAHRKEETIPWERIKFYVDEQKMNKMVGLDRSWQANDEREAYKWWKAFHNLMSYMLFDMSMT